MYLDKFKLTDKVAVITGAARGIGLATAQALAEAGALVVLTDMNAEMLESAAADLTSKGFRVETERLDVTDSSAAQRVNDAVVARHGRVDVLVNNAGSSPLYPSLVEVSEELFDKTLAVNLKGAFRLSALVGTRMADGDGGVIINVSSIAALAPTPVELPYALAKAGLNALTAGLSKAFGPTVRVNAIMPGPFLTDISRAWDMDAFQRRADEAIPLRRGGRPEEIVGAALYLASDASSYTSGSVITVDGGATA
jgi:NAD(P)-dependent dehydrogenase (short-subunit alcohol dehydrogenase family)